MSEAVIVALIASVPPTLVAVVSLVAIVRSHKKVEQITLAVKDVHLAMNSRFDEWMSATKLASFAEGVKSEIDKRNIL